MIPGILAACPTLERYRTLSHNTLEELGLPRRPFRGGGKTLLDNKVSSIYPAVVSQPIKQRKLGLIEGLPATITYSQKAKPTARPLRPQARWRNEQRRSSRYELPPPHSILIAA